MRQRKHQRLSFINDPALCVGLARSSLTRSPQFKLFAALKIMRLLLVLFIFFSVASGMSTAQAETHPATPLPAEQADIAEFKSRLASAGIDPESPKGIVLQKYFSKVRSDPSWGSLEQRREGGGVRDWMLSMTLNAHERTQVMNEFRKLVATPRDCQTFKSFSNNAWLSSSAPSEEYLEAMFQILDIFVHHQDSTPQAEANYSLADRVTADVSVNVAALPFDEGDTKPTSEQMCNAFRAVIDSIDAMPAPLQARASWEFFSMLRGEESGIKAVLKDPNTYFDSMFNESSLPDAVKRGLPDKGSQILPFKRLTITGDWVSARKPSKPVFFKSNIVNRNDNGVVSEQTVTMDEGGTVTWAAFRTYYRLADLRSQELWGDSRIGMASLDDDAAIRATKQKFVKGAEFDIPVPQPSIKGEKSMQCRVGDTKPASSVFRSLTGSAIETHCSVVTRDGAVNEYDDVWLDDYNVDLTLRFIDEGGTTNTVIRDISVEPNRSLKARGSSAREIPYICFSC
jgi:hypothetical protein